MSEQKPTAFIILPRSMFASEEDRRGVPEDVQEAVRTAGYEPLLDDPAQPWGGNSVIALINNLLKAQAVIVDLTGFNSYVVYSLGIAMTLRERVILLLQDDEQQLPKPLSSEFCIFYTNTAAGIRQMRELLKRATKHHASLGAEDGNLVQRALPETLRTALRDPTRLTGRPDAVDMLLREQKEMQLIISQVQAQLSVLTQSQTISIANEQIDDLRARLDEVSTKRSRTEMNLRQLMRERDAMLVQIMQSAHALENDRVLITSPHDDAELVFVPAGLFVPGPPRATEAERREAERFVQAFYVDRYPVTNSQFARFVKATGYLTVAERHNRDLGCEDPTWCIPRGPRSSIQSLQHHPVVQIYREDALAYADWVGRRLPTRLEWERAARGVVNQMWPWGDQWDSTACNLNSEGTMPVDDHPQGMSPVGCEDMVGNVWEWTADNLPGSKRLLMGGSWAEQRLPAVYKALVVPVDGADAATGFRCAMDVP